MCKALSEHVLFSPPILCSLCHPTTDAGRPGHEQNLANRSLFVSLNPQTTPGGTFFDETMEHPVMDLRAFAAQECEAQHQGIDGVYHAGMRVFLGS